MLFAPTIITLRHCADNYAQDAGFNQSKSVRDLSEDEDKQSRVYHAIKGLSGIVHVRIMGQTADKVIERAIEETEAWIKRNQQPPISEVCAYRIEIMKCVLEALQTYRLDVLGTTGRYCGPVIPRQTWRMQLRDLRAARRLARPSLG